MRSKVPERSQDVGGLDELRRREAQLKAEISVTRMTEWRTLAVAVLLVGGIPYMILDRYEGTAGRVAAGVAFVALAVAAAAGGWIRSMYGGMRARINDLKAELEQVRNAQDGMDWTGEVPPNTRMNGPSATDG